MNTAKIGSISHGTLRTEDLLSTFISTLEGLMLINGDYFSSPLNFSERDRLSNLIGEAQDLFSDNGEDIPEEKWEEASEMLNERLFDALQEFAPPYCVFGAHEGDGSDFGYWPDIENAKDDLEFVSDSDDEFPFDEYRGEWLHVNDHGNCTLYVRQDDGKDVEIWSVV